MEESAKGTKTQAFAHPKQPQPQEAGIAVGSPPSNHVTTAAIIGKRLIIRSKLTCVCIHNHNYNSQ